MNSKYKFQSFKLIIMLARGDISKMAKQKALFPDRDTNLTSIYGPKSFYESSRNQLRCSTPSTAKPRMATLKRINKTIAFYPLQTFLQADRAQQDQEKMSNLLFPSWEGKERMEHRPNILVFGGCRGGCPRDQFLSHVITSTDTEPSYFAGLGPQGTPESLAACCSSTEPAAPPMNTRGSKRL